MTIVIHEYKVYGTTVKKQLYPSDEKERYFHIYYSSKNNAEREKLENKIAKLAKDLKKREGRRILSFQIRSDIISHRSFIRMEHFCHLWKGGMWSNMS